MAAGQRFIRQEVDRPGTQALIREEGSRLFYERGYFATSVREIAAAVNIQPATIYHYFGSKEALLYDIMQRFMVDLIEDTAPLQSIDDPVEKLRWIVTHHVCFHCTRPTEAYVSDNELHCLTGEFHEEMMRYRDHYQSIFRQILEGGVRRGVFFVDDVKVITNMLLSMITGAVIWYRPEGRLSLDDIAALHVEMALRQVAQPTGDCKGNLEHVAR
jgi:TetR/AcrR family transcriptional regulator, cholesterol catabolism regulator